MRVERAVFHEPKLGAEPSEYEDAFWPSRPVGLARRFAVADGATDSSFSGHWARLLVESYGSGHTSRDSFSRRLDRLRQRWLAARSVLELPWYAEQKLEQGAHATFIGVSIRAIGSQLAVHSLAAGDSVLVHTTDERVHCSFPILHSSAFGSTPALLSTRRSAAENRALLKSRCEVMKPHPGRDQLLIMTDAIAAWFLRESEAQRNPVTELSRVTSGGAAVFREWVDGVRSSHLMRNDDVTLQVLRP